jgi:hypothetical protein
VLVLQIGSGSAGSITALAALAWLPHEEPIWLEVPLTFEPSPAWVTLLTKRIGSAAAKCSNQADLRLTFTDPI